MRRDYTSVSLRNPLLPPTNHLAFVSYCTDMNTEVQKAHPRSCPDDTSRLSQGFKRPVAWAHGAVLYCTELGIGVS